MINQTETGWILEAVEVGRFAAMWVNKHGLFLFVRLSGGLHEFL